MKVILCGYNWVGCKALSILLERGDEVFVFTHENPSHVNSLKDLCEKLKIPFTTSKITRENIPFKPDIICSIYYRYIIDSSVINFVEKKIFNLHPSLLPYYRGCSSITWAMINDESKVGFTYHYLDEGIDTGNIIFQNEINVEDWDTQITLYHRVMFEAIKFFRDVLEMVLNGEIGTLQKGKDNYYYSRGCPHEGIIDPAWSEAKIERFIRAMNYPPLPYAKVNNITIKTISDYRSWLDNKTRKN